ncbi:cytochrome P450 4C1-like isoform X1 [Tenebrio molitor]|uniref:cytochrome P450 4C1-like isoform X1 n=1 Tax=Tenebrio molitor TaxID=7067 RepID=UPI00362489E5
MNIVMKENNLNVSSVLFHLSSVVLVLFIINYCWKRRKLYYHAAKLKGPFALPFLGSIHLCSKSPDDWFLTSLEIVEKYAPIGKIWLGPYLFIGVTDSDDLEYVMKHCLAKGSWYNFLYQLFGNGILTAPISTWRAHRKIINQTFNQTILNSYFDIFVGRSNELIVNLKKNYINCETNIFLRYYESSFKIICDTCMGVDSADLNHQNEYLSWIAEFGSHIVKRFPNPILQINLVWRLLGYEKRLDQLCGRIYAYVRKILERKKMSNKDEVGDSSNNKNYLSNLIKATEEEGKWTDEEMMEETQTMIAAGSDTTALTLSFATIMLAMHQDFQEKLYKEMCDIFGNTDRDPTLDDLTRMDYLERVIKETMRLFPIAPILFRHVQEDIKIRDIVIPEGSELLIPVHFIHRNPIHWPDPLKFDPDRFLPEEIEKRPRYSFMPFSIPPRNCIGMSFAMMSMKVSLSNVIRNFRIISTQYKSVESIKLLINVVIASKDGYGVTLKPRK